LPANVTFPDDVAIEVEDGGELKRGRLERGALRWEDGRVWTKAAASTADASSIKEPTSFKQLLETGAVQLIWNQWVQKTFVQGGVNLVRRQDLPLEAIASAAEAVKLLEEDPGGIAVLSHAWLSPDHPDPFGYRRSDMKAIENHYMVFFDFLSMFQGARDAEQDYLFEFASRGMHFVFSNPNIEVFRFTGVPLESSNVTPYVDRGWCFLETVLASVSCMKLITVPEKGMAPVAGAWVHVANDFESDNEEPTMSLKKGDRGFVVQIDDDGDAEIKFQRFFSQTAWVRAGNFGFLDVEPKVITPMPNRPQEFEAAVRKLHFTFPDADTDLVVELYAKMWPHICEKGATPDVVAEQTTREGGAITIDAEGSKFYAYNWGDAEVQQFQEVLSEMQYLKKIELHQCTASKATLESLVAVIHGRGGQLWLDEHMTAGSLWGNQLSDFFGD